MTFFLISCIFLLSIVLWWAEAKYNYFYGLLKLFRKLCSWIKSQTKLKIDICKWFLPSIFLFMILYFLWSSLYLPYFRETTDFKDGEIKLKDYSEKSYENQKDLSKQAENSIVKVEIIKHNEQESPIGDWGTFGDFIGGTLNPIIGLISVLLLFGTWRLTSNTYRSTDVALKSQQFDSWFFNLLESFQSRNINFSQKKLDKKFYEALFIKKEKNLALAQDIDLINYFSSLKLLLQTIDTKLDFVISEQQKAKLKNFYIEIVLSQVSAEMLQVLGWYAFKNEDLKSYIEELGFFRNMDFKYYKDGKSNAFESYNYELLSNLHRYSEKAFQNSPNFLALKKSYLFLMFFENAVSIHQFFKKQYKNSIEFELVDGSAPAWYLALNFEENQLKILEISKKGIDNLTPQKVGYNEMIFYQNNITVIVDNFFKFNIPEGDLSKIHIEEGSQFIIGNFEIK